MAHLHQGIDYNAIGNIGQLYVQGLQAGLQNKLLQGKLAEQQALQGAQKTIGGGNLEDYYVQQYKQSQELQKQKQMQEDMKQIVDIAKFNPKGATDIYNKSMVKKYGLDPMEYKPKDKTFTNKKTGATWVMQDNQMKQILPGEREINGVLQRQVQDPATGIIRPDVWKPVNAYTPPPSLQDQLSQGKLAEQQALQGAQKTIGGGSLEDYYVQQYKQKQEIKKEQQAQEDLKQIINIAKFDPKIAIDIYNKQLAKKYGLDSIKYKPTNKPSDQKVLFDLEQKKKKIELNKQALLYLKNIDKSEFKNNPQFLADARKIALSLPEKNIKGKLLRKKLNINLTAKDELLSFKKQKEKRIAGTYKTKAELKKKELESSKIKAKLKKKELELKGKKLLAEQQKLQKKEKQKQKEKETKKLGEEILQTTEQVRELASKGEDTNKIIQVLKTRYKDIPNSDTLIRGILLDAGITLK